MKKYAIPIVLLFLTGCTTMQYSEYHNTSTGEQTNIHATGKAAVEAAKVNKSFNDPSADRNARRAGRVPEYYTPPETQRKGQVEKTIDTWTNGAGDALRYQGLQQIYQFFGLY